MFCTTANKKNPGGGRYDRWSFVGFNGPCIRRKNLHAVERERTGRFVEWVL